MADDGLLAVGGVGVLAVLALVVSLLRDGGDRVINIPSDFGSVGSDESNTGESTAPDDLQNPASDNYQFEEPDQQWSEDRYDFGGPSGSGSDPNSSPDGGSGPSSSIPDSLADFNPGGRVDLVNQDGDSGGTWVGL